MSKDSDFIETTISGYTENLKRCPNPLCRCDDVKLFRKVEAGISRCLIICMKCRTMSPASKRMIAETEDDICKIGIAVCMAWDKLPRYDIGVKYVDTDVMNICPWCHSDDAMLTSSTCGCGEHHHCAIICPDCLMAGASYTYYTGEDEKKAMAEKSALYAWNLLVVTEQDNVQ